METLRQVKLQTPLRVYSSDGVLIGEFGEKRRTPIAYEEAPEPFVQAILAAEDDRFYSHHGVDIKGLLRAASQLLQSGHIQTGGSTITMQVARNFFLTRKQTFTRKFNEILLALQIERELSKEEILELYMNKIYLGNRAYGIQAAAQAYYGKNINELNLAQLAMIAGLPKAPSAYNPIANPSRAMIRRNWILGRMLELEYIDNLTYQEALKEPVTASYHGSGLGLDAPYIAEMARKKTVDLFGEAAYTDGYQVYTTVSSELQSSAQQAVIKGLLTYDNRHGYRGPETSLPIIDAPTASAEFEATNTIDEQAQAEATEATVFSTEQLEAWQTALKSMPTYASLRAAVVTMAQGQELQVMTAYGQLINIDWNNGPSNAKPYISENRVGRAPKATEDFLSAGDVVRISEKSPDNWQLAQIPSAQAALVALNPDDGGIQALVGGLDFRQSHFNRATQAERQPGSNFKPFIYTAALENGLTPATVINDAPIVFDDASLESTWRPENASGKFFGPTRLRQALFKSRNLVSIRVLRTIGTGNAITGMSRFGFNEETLPHDLSLALGSHGVPPLQIATAYAVFANGGYQVEPYLIDQITDAEGQTLYQALPLTVCRECENQESDLATADNDTTIEQPELSAEQELQSLIDQEDSFVEAAPEPGIEEEPLSSDLETSEPLQPQRPIAPKVLDAKVAYIIDNMLRDVIKKGTGRRAQVLGRSDLAGKTGTTNGPKDAWFSGYNGHMVATTWLGFDQNLPLGRGEYGGSAALPIWIDFMRTALDGIPETVREQPDGLITVRIDPETGLRARPDNPDAIFEIFRTENAPTLEDDNSDTPAVYTEEESLPDELF
ncbi:penicillin-binding protein 1A [Maricurvus nonylphenolicus]|uniref:penicillin-binding protein 1A n=1 Tax=Maricurvus nonylphenolicus TaxID=1008307 RepID=UPI0036F23711